MLVPGLFAYGQVVAKPAYCLVVEVMGEQWRWKRRLPGLDGIFGRTDVRLTSGDNVFGIDMTVAAADDIVIGGPPLPARGRALMQFRARDVLHNFWVPDLEIMRCPAPSRRPGLFHRKGTYQAACARVLRHRPLRHGQRHPRRRRRGVRPLVGRTARGGGDAGERAGLVLMATPALAPPWRPMRTTQPRASGQMLQPGIPRSSRSSTPAHGPLVGAIGLVMSWLLRLQLGFPGTFALSRVQLLPVHDLSRHDHGHILVDGPPAGRVRQHLIPLMSAPATWLFWVLNSRLLDLPGFGHRPAGRVLRARVTRAAPAGSLPAPVDHRGHARRRRPGHRRAADLHRPVRDLAPWAA